jgi:glutaconate CoA-transferase, subunit B
LASSRDLKGENSSMLFYKPREIMAIMAGRMINNGDIIFCGTGLSLITATVAKKIYAPDSIIFFETGGIDAALPELPISVADLRVMYQTSVNAGLIESFSILSNPKIHSKAFLGAAQIDKYGNLNSTSVGNYWHPTMRFSGSGGGGDAACLAAEVIIFMPHEKRRFVSHLDYLTSPGWINGPGSRETSGLSRGGPTAVVTNLGIMKFDETTKEMYLHQCYSGVTPETVQENTGFDIDLSRAVEAPPITIEELRILRGKVDPQKLII